MATSRQELGAFGERHIAQNCTCPRCKRSRTLVLLPPNFKCADLICDFSGYLAQVKATRVKDVSVLPRTILGAAWGPQKERMASGVYFPFFIVLVSETSNAIYYLSSDLEMPEMFKERTPLSSTARRAGRQDFHYDLSDVRDRLVGLV